MLRTSIHVAVVCTALSAPGVSNAQTRCPRADLQSAVNSYLAAQGQGSVSKGLTRLMSSLLFRVGAVDALTFSAVSGLLLMTALLAC